MFVELDKHNFNPLRFCLPFYFRENRIEYCTSIRNTVDGIVCYVSLNDADPAEICIDIEDLSWCDVGNF